MRFPRRNAVREEEIAALADDSLAGERREELEAHVAASTELQGRLDEQRRALALVETASAEVEAPAGLRARVEAERRPRPARVRARPVALAAGFAVAAAVAVALVLTLPREVGGPDFADAATLGDRPPTGAAPQPLAGEPKLLDQALERVPFPNWAAKFGWRATGVRTDRVGGRDAVTVFYEKNGRRIAYTIVSGKPLEVPAGAVPARREGVDLHALVLGGRQVVTWERLGYTCILSGDLDRPTLLKLAAWKGQGERSRLGVEPAGDLLPRAVQPAHHRSLAGADRRRGLPVAQPHDVDGHQDVAVVVGKLRDRLVDLPSLERALRLRRRVLVDELLALRKRRGPRPAALGAEPVEERVPEDAEEVAEVVLAAEEARPREHTCVRVLDEILGVLA